MPAPQTNARTLLMRIFESWHEENVAHSSPDTAFEIFASELSLRPYGLGLENIQDGIVGAGQDGGIDSVFSFWDDNLLDEDSEIFSEARRPSEFPQERLLELWVIQAKRSPSFEEGALDKLENTLRRLLDLSQDIEVLKGLYNDTLLSRVDLFRRAWEKLLVRRPKVAVNVVYATPGDRQGVNPQVLIKLGMFQRTVSELLPPDSEVDCLLFGDRELLARYNEKPTYSLPMRFQENATSGDSHVALVTLKDYFSLITDENKKLRRYLFDWNVRDYQGAVTVNQEIRRTLENPESPEFWWLNNGVTIICSEAITGGKTYSLTDIQIVNGLQTSHTIYESLRDNPDIEIGSRMILVRIISTTDRKTRDQVIRATNRQTPVNDASLRATDEIQRNIEDYFLVNGWYYDRRKNFYKNEGKDPAKIIGIPLLGQALTAMGLCRPDKARGKPSSLLKNDDDYLMVFNSNVNLSVFLWAAKTQRTVDVFLHSEHANATQAQRNNLKFHLSMLVAVELANARINRPQQLEQVAKLNHPLDAEFLERRLDVLKEYTQAFLGSGNTTLEKAAKNQQFTNYILARLGF
ncbi:AIPR family protein [Streptosporangium sp. NPDC001559]|uniref:AIPR family protein n=1 Tax=Streptosporangium sp. NPDC001559 TaxID=3366187 RepID=UPI0036E7BD74